MKQIVLQKENDFKKINHLPFNREFSVREDLIKSMNNSGFIVPIILLKTDLIDGRDKLWVLDGQHRCITARFLNIPVYAQIIEPNNVNCIEDVVKLVSSLNSNSKKWSLLNYVEAYAFLNYKDYKRLLNITSKCPYSINTIAHLLAGYSSKGSQANRPIMDGTYKITDEEGTMEVINYAAKLSKYERISSRMLIALKRTMNLKRFNEDVFTKKYKQNIEKIKDLNLDDYTAVFTSWVV